MPKSTTAQGEETRDEDSASSTTEDEQNSNEHSEDSEENEEETSEENESESEDSEDGAPEDEDEEDADPLKKAKKFADRKITELGTKLSQSSQKMVEMVKKSPELLIEMYDENSSLYDRDLADKIRYEFPDVYQQANQVFRARVTQQRAGGNQTYANQGAQTDGQAVGAEEYLRKQMAMMFSSLQRENDTKSALSTFRQRLGYSEEEFSKLAPSLVSVAESIQKIDPERSYSSALEHAFIAMFPGDYEKDVKKKTLVGVSEKLALQSGGGKASSSAGKKKLKITQQDREAAAVAKMSVERYMELQGKYNF